MRFVVTKIIPLTLGEALKKVCDELGSPAFFILISFLKKSKRFERFFLNFLSQKKSFCPILLKKSYVEFFLFHLFINENTLHFVKHLKCTYSLDLAVKVCSIYFHIIFYIIVIEI